MANNSHKVLIVDDSAMARKMMKRAVAGLLPQAEISEAAEAESGLHKWTELRPDISIFDLNMPGQSGLELAEKVLAENVSAKIVLCTANVQQATQDKAREMGIGFVAKPVNAEKLQAVLDLETA